MSVARALRFKCRSSSCPVVASQGWLNAECQDLLSCCALKLTGASWGMADIWGSALCHHTHLGPSASVPSQGPPSADTARLAAPCPCLTLKKCFFSQVECPEWQCLECLCNVCVMCRSAHSDWQKSAWHKALCWSCHMGAVRRASGLELELLVLRCPSRGAAAEAAETFTFPPRVLCWHQALQTSRAVSMGDTVSVFWHRSCTAFCFRYQLA